MCSPSAGPLEGPRNVRISLPRYTATEQMRLVVRSLLEDRFKLAVRREQREMRGPALVLARRDGRAGGITAEVASEGRGQARFDLGDPQYGLSPQRSRFLDDPALTLPLQVRHAAIDRVDQFAQVGDDARLARLRRGGRPYQDERPADPRLALSSPAGFHISPHAWQRQ